MNFHFHVGAQEISVESDPNFKLKFDGKLYTKETTVTECIQSGGNWMSLGYLQVKRSKI